MTDLASVGYRVDTAGLDQGIRKLDEFGRSNAAATRQVAASAAAMRTQGSATAQWAATVQRAAAVQAQMTQAQQATYAAAMRTTAAISSSGTAIQGAFAPLPAMLGGVQNVLNTFGQQAHASGQRAAAGVGLARHELINLSRQAQDVFVSLSSGQNPLTVLIQQGTQIADVFAASTGTVRGFFSQALAWAGRIFTPMRIAALAVAGIGIAATMAASQFGDAQREIDRALLGMGRASGLTRTDVNGIANRASSLFGFSVAEARQFTTTIAATGRVGREQLEQVVKAGRDIATVLGVDAPEAADILAKALADPARGAEQLNQRFGFLSAATQRQIENLMAQNRVYEAQQVLIDGIKSGAQGVGETISTTTNFFRALGNATSNIWTSIGSGLARLTGLGFSEGLDEQIERTRKRIEELTKMRERRAPTARTDIDAALERESAALAQLTGRWEAYWKSVEAAQQRRDSHAQRRMVDSVMPEIGQREGVQNLLLGLNLTRAAIERTGGAASPILREMGMSFDELTRAIDRAKTASQDLQTTMQREVAQHKIAVDAITAYSPAARAEIAARERRLELMQRTDLSREEKEYLAVAAGVVALKNAMEALKESQRERMLGARQSIDLLRVELEVANASIAVQERAMFAARIKAEIERENARYRIGGAGSGDDVAKAAEFNRQIDDQVTKLRERRELLMKDVPKGAFEDRWGALSGPGLSTAELERRAREVAEIDAKVKDLTESKKQAAAVPMDTPPGLPRQREEVERLAAEYGKLRQAIAEIRLASDVAFERSQVFRSDTEQGIASRLRSVYGNDYAQQMDGAIAQQMRLNAALVDSKQAASEFAKGFIADLRAGKSAAEALQNALDRLATRLIDKAIDGLINAAFGGLFGGIGGGGLGSLNSAVMVAHAGWRMGRSAVTRQVDPAYFANAPRFHGGRKPWGPNEMPAIIEKTEEILTRSDPRHSANIGATRTRQTPTLVFGDTNIHLSGKADQDDADMIKRELHAHREAIKDIQRGAMDAERERGYGVG